MAVVFLRVTGFGSYTSVVEQARSLVNAHGTLLDVHLFSDVALAMHVELHEGHAHAFLEALDRVFRVERESLQVAREKLRDSERNERGTVMLHVTVADGEGNVEREVPNVPG